MIEAILDGTKDSNGEPVTLMKSLYITIQKSPIMVLYPIDYYHVCNNLKYNIIHLLF